jgi:hypothetical protein
MTVNGYDDRASCDGRACLSVRALVHAFIRSECEEAAVRGALNDAAPSTETRMLRQPAIVGDLLAAT